MITANVDYSGLNRGIEGLIYRVGLNARTVLPKEVGELIKTLVNISPPTDRQKTNENIARDINTKFSAASDKGLSNRPGTAGVAGPSGIIWYAVDSKFLYGVGPEKDMRKASAADLESLRWRISPKTGRQSLPFRHTRSRQRVLLRQSLITRLSTIKKVIANARGNVGRLKAAWMVAVVRGEITLTGGNRPPGWVTKHLGLGLQGNTANNLGDPKKPSFTIMNFARGIGQRKVNGLVNDAVNIRAKAMQVNAALFLKGKKKLSDYSR